jgi:hypothetical protein
VTSASDAIRTLEGQRLEAPELAARRSDRGCALVEVRNGRPYHYASTFAWLVPAHVLGIAAEPLKVEHQRFGSGALQRRMISTTRQAPGAAAFILPSLICTFLTDCLALN